MKLINQQGDTIINFDNVLAVTIVQTNKTSWFKTYTITAALIRESFELGTYETLEEANNAFDGMIESFKSKKILYRFPK